MSLFLDEENNRDFFIVRKEYELSTVYEANKPVYTYLSKVVENDESSFLKRITRYDINGDIIKEDNYEDDDFSLPNVIEDVVLDEAGRIQTRIRYSDGRCFISKYEYTEDGKLSSILKLKHNNQAELVKYAYNERGEIVRTARIKSDGANWESETKILSVFPRETTTCIETDGEISCLSYTQLNHKGIPIKHISIYWRNGAHDFLC